MCIAGGTQAGLAVLPFAVALLPAQVPASDLGG